MRPAQIAILAALVPALIFAQKKEVQEMQRDVLLMQDQIRTLQRTLDEKLAALTVLVQQTLDASNKANTAVAVLERQMNEKLADQQKTVAAPVAGLGSKVDMLADEFRFVRESVNDLNSKMSKLNSQFTDVSNAVKTLQAPPPPPDPVSGGGGSPSTPPPGLSADQLYSSALRDKSSGKYDIALSQFQDYLRWFENTDLAPNAQFHVGDILYIKGDYQSAVDAFDAVLERYSDTNPKAPDALFMKGRSLMQLGQRNAAATEYRELVKRFPNHETAAKARAELKNMGLSATAPAAPARKKK
jgi:tol-pal system protein YbgF